MKKAKSRIKKKRPTAQERATTLCVILGSIVTGYIILGSGQVKTMLDTWTPEPEMTLKNLLIVETRERGYSEKQQIMDYIIEKFGNDANLAITMLTTCENGELNTKAKNYNRNGTVDSGVFQINSIHDTPEEMENWRDNVDMAYKIYHAQGDLFTAWTCAGVIGQTNYLGQ